MGVVARRILYSLLAFVSTVFVGEFATYVFADSRDFEKLLRITPEPMRSTYVRFVLSVPSSWFNSRDRKVRILGALWRNHVDGPGDIPFDGRWLTPLLDAHNVDYEEPVRPMAGYLLALSGDPQVVELAFQRWSRDFASVCLLRFKIEQVSSDRPAAYLRVKPVVDRYDEILRRRFGRDYPY